MQFLEGYKTYIVAFVTILYAVIQFWISQQTSADLNTMMLTIFAALGVGTLRSTLDKFLAAFGATIPREQRSMAMRRAMQRAGYIAPTLLACVLAVPFLSACGTTLGGTVGSVLNGQGTNIQRGLIAGEGIQAGWIAVCINLIGEKPGFCRTNHASAQAASTNLVKAAHCVVGAYEGNGANLAACQSDLADVLVDFAPLTNGARAERAARLHAAFDILTAVQILQVVIQVAKPLYDEIVASGNPSNADLDALVQKIEEQNLVIQGS